MHKLKASRGLDRTILVRRGRPRSTRVLWQTVSSPRVAMEDTALRYIVAEGKLPCAGSGGQSELDVQSTLEEHAP